jgi:predicted MFS family arabinose efflux permease
LGERLGVVRPILLGVSILAANQFLLVNAPAPAVFSMALLIQGLTFAFYIPYVMALVGRLDRSGRLVGALPGLITIGASIGPALGGTVLATWSFRTLAPVAAGLYILALILFWSAGRLMHRGKVK